MTIKELEERLGVPRATIRFYEKEELINPKRTDNSYREYSEEDVAVLKKIILLRKIGLSVSDIKRVFDEECSLQDMIRDNISKLHNQMEEIEGAIRISEMLQDRNENIVSLNEEIYWDEMNKLEESGYKFKEIVNDLIGFEKKLTYGAFGLADIEDVVDKEKNIKVGIKKTIFYVVAVFLWMGILYELIGGDFHDGIYSVVVRIALITVFGVPIYFLFYRKKK